MADEKKSGGGNALILRVVLLGVLAGVLALWWLDRQAAKKCQAAHDRVHAELMPEKGKPNRQVTPERVQELVGFAPTLSGTRVIEEYYYFPSFIRKYRLTVQYVGDKAQRFAQECEQAVGAAP